MKLFSLLKIENLELFSFAKYFVGQRQLMQICVGDRKLEQANIKMDIVKCIITNKKVKRIWHEFLLTKRKNCKVY